MGATISDVARKAGVSKAAVSYVLNGRETAVRISDETRARIVKAAGDLRYSPNALARGLAQKRTDTVALVMQFPAIFSGWSGFTNEMMRGACEAAIRLGYDLMLHTKEQPTLEQEVAALTDGRADAALLLRDLGDPLVQALSERGFPCVLFFGRSTDPAIRYVDCDNVAGGRIATEYLLDLGHTRIMHLAGTSRSSAASDRRIGYEHALRAHGIEPVPSWTVEIAFSGASYDPIERLLHQDHRPTAAFCWSDEVAMRLMTLARGIGLSVPTDLSIIGFDSTEICEHVHPALTSVRQPVPEMAECAFDMVVRELRGEEVERTQVLFEPSVVVRGSCAPPQR